MDTDERLNRIAAAFGLPNADVDESQQLAQVLALVSSAIDRSVAAGLVPKEAGAAAIDLYKYSCDLLLYGKTGDARAKSVFAISAMTLAMHSVGKMDEPSASRRTAILVAEGRERTRRSRAIKAAKYLDPDTQFQIVDAAMQKAMSSPGGRAKIQIAERALTQGLNQRLLEAAAERGVSAKTYSGPESLTKRYADMLNERNL